MNVHSITGLSFETLRRALVCALLAACMSVAQADDTEIYFGTAGALGATANSTPNVIFILDTSGSMSNPPGGAVSAYDPLRDYGSSDDDYVYVYRSPNFTEVFINNHRPNGQVTISKTSLDANCRTGLTDIAVAATPYYTTKAVYEEGDNATINNHRELDQGTDMGPDEPVWCEADAGAYAGNPAGSGTGDCDDWDHGNCNDVYVLVSANYHDYLLPIASKRNVMVNTAKSLVDQFTGLNMAIMRFNGEHGGYVLKHSTSTASPADRQILKDTLDTLPADGLTPLSETYWEAFRYLKGQSQDYGNDAGAATDSAAGDPYNSPIIGQCQQNHIVYLTDGQPVADVDRNANIAALIGTACSAEAFGADGQCLDDLAAYMFNHDFNTTTLSGTQNVITHTIGFGLASDPTALAYLDKTAKAGGSKGVYQADTAAELVAAFNSIVTGIMDSSGSFAAPAVQSGVYNRLQGSNRLYYGMFKPVNSPRWVGNVKKYGLGVDETGQEIDVLSIDGNNAIDNNTGFFKSTAESYWSGTKDGAETDRGGAASRLSDPANRTFVTSIGGVTVPVNSSNITAAMLGAADDAERDAILEWARGFVAGSTTPTYFMADVLHSRPSLLQYEPSASKPEVVIAGSNLGILHAFNTSNGSERFAFIPRELLPNLKAFYHGAGDHLARVYGMDGPNTVWHQLKPSSTPGLRETGHAYLYTGLRRGGKHLYAIDISDPDQPPALKWQISGGTTGFGRMGETWAEPAKTRVKVASSTEPNRDVLIFGGGYDPQYDTNTYAAPGTSPKMGNAIYMVDAKTGALLWSVSNTTSNGIIARSDMTHSFVSEINLWDVDGDGFADFFFTIDVGGQVWRFDLKKTPIQTDGSDFIAGGGVIANLNGNSATTFRKFYNDLNVELLQGDTGVRFSINVGSGYREKPLEKTQNIDNRIFTIFDHNVYAPPSGYDYTYVESPADIIREDDLVDASTWNPATDPVATYGWYRPLDASIGEKAISSGTTLGRAIALVTYVPGNATACAAQTGSNRLYLLDALTGQSLLQGGAAYQQLKLGGIAPEPVITYVTQKVKVKYMDKYGQEQETEKEILVPVIIVGTEVIAPPPGSSEFGVTVQYWGEK